jgi:hypothetical protein
VPPLRLVRADLSRDDRDLERHADRLHRGLDEIAVRVREDPEPPPPITGFREPGRHVAEHRPGRKRAGERARFSLRQRQTGLAGKPHETDGQHLAVAGTRARRLDLRLELVIAGEQHRRVLDAEVPLELGSDATVPVDERAVAVECRPALRHGGSLVS